jgi:hypothetical protein
MRLEELRIELRVLSRQRIEMHNSSVHLVALKLFPSSSIEDAQISNAAEIVDSTEVEELKSDLKRKKFVLVLVLRSP